MFTVFHCRVILVSSWPVDLKLSALGGTETKRTTYKTEIHHNYILSHIKQYYTDEKHLSKLGMVNVVSPISPKCWTESSFCLKWCWDCWSLIWYLLCFSYSETFNSIAGFCNKSIYFIWLDFGGLVSVESIFIDAKHSSCKQKSHFF